MKSSSEKVFYETHSHINWLTGIIVLVPFILTALIILIVLVSLGYLLKSSSKEFVVELKETLAKRKENRKE